MQAAVNERQKDKERIEELEKELAILKATKPRIVADDPYELLLMCNLLNLDAKIRDTLAANPTTLSRKSTKDEVFSKILNMFRGRTITEKKQELINFLREHPALRTLNLELLMQRIYMWQHYKELFEQRTFPSNPISEVIAEEEPPQLIEEE